MRHGEIFNCTEVSYVPAYGSPTVTDRQHHLATDERGIPGRLQPTVLRPRGAVPLLPLLPVCGGSCPKAWLEGEPACPSFKWHLPTRLLFELGGGGVLRTRPGRRGRSPTRRPHGLGVVRQCR